MIRWLDEVWDKMEFRIEKNNKKREGVIDILVKGFKLEDKLNILWFGW